MTHTNSNCIKQLVLGVVAALLMSVAFSTGPSATDSENNPTDTPATEMSGEQAVEAMYGFFEKFETLFLVKNYIEFYGGWEWKGIDRLPRDFLEYLAEQGDPSAQANLGKQLYPGPWKDPCLGLYWLTQAARGGHVGAIQWVSFGNYVGFTHETREDATRYAFLWAMQWGRVFNYDQNAFFQDMAADTFEISEANKDEYITLFHSLERSVLPSTPKESCAITVEATAEE